MEALERKGSLIIRDASDWFAGIDRLEGAKARIMDLWLDEERRALDAGYNGLRITGNTAFVNPADWSAFMEYEEYAEERSRASASSRSAATFSTGAPARTCSTWCAATVARWIGPTKADGRSSDTTDMGSPIAGAEMVKAFIARDLSS